MNVPGKFWKTMTEQEFIDFVRIQNGVLNADQCERLWHMMEYQGEPPKSLEILFNRADVVRIAESQINR